MSRKKSPKLGQWEGWEGYWILPDGTERQASDHYVDVQLFPEVYGYTAEQVATWKAKDRTKVLRAMMRHGFIRVRGHRNFTTFEFAAWDDQTADRIIDFTDRHGFWPQDRVSLHSLHGEIYTGQLKGMVPVAK